MISFRHTIHTAIIGLRTNTMRSIFTIFGVAIGITAIVSILSIGDGAQNLVLGQVEALGSNTLFVAPGQEPTGPSDFSFLFIDSLKKRELLALQNKTLVPHIVDVTPDVFVPGKAVYGSEISLGSIVGTGTLFSDILSIETKEGDFFTTQDIEDLNKVVIIGKEVKDDLFGESDALGKKIKLKGQNFKVIGIYGDVGTVALFNVDKAILIPYSTAQKYLTGTDYYNEFLIRIDDEAYVQRTKYDIEVTLRELHNIDDPEKDDFHVMTQKDIAERLSTITNILTALLVAVAGISLAVGGIGIMNIMLVSVTERTKEIGLRKSLGATRGNIMTQFLLEAVMLTAVGGILGVILGAGISYLLSFVLAGLVSPDWKFSLPLSSIYFGVLVSVGIGLVFGLYPAKKASEKSPIEALRYE